MPRPFHSLRHPLRLQLAVGFLAAAMLTLGAGCARPKERERGGHGGDVELGKQAIQRYGCGGCHLVPGVPGAEGRAAQPLFGFADRADIAGAAPNTYENLVVWLQEPAKITPRSRMPKLNVSEKDARDIAAYLLTLRTE